MKLSRIPGHESTVKHSFAFKQSTAALLLQYQEMYATHTGIDVSLKDVVEQMLLDFMSDDKAFQKELARKKQAASAPAPAPAEPKAAASATNDVDSGSGDFTGN